MLSSFDFTMEHRAGRNHGNADALSRNTCHQCGFGVQSDTEELLHSEDYTQKAKEILNTRLATTQIIRQLSMSTSDPTTTDSPMCWLTGWDHCSVQCNSEGISTHTHIHVTYIYGG